MAKKLISLIALLIVMHVALFYFALKKPSSEAFPISGYPVHFLALFSVSLVLYLILSEIDFNDALIWTFLYALLVAVSIEFLQKFLTTYRTFDYLDMLSGALGSLSLCLIVYVWKRFI